MNNLILHLISNRPGPFQDPLLGSNPGFIPTIIPADEQVLRNELYLNKTETDYYLKVYLAVLNAYPDWKQQFGYNLAESYKPEEIMPKGVCIQGGDLIAYAGGSGLYIGLPANILPVELHYQITWVSEYVCQIAGLETNILTNAVVAVTGNDPNKILRISWPGNIPFTGPLQLNQEWAEGAIVDIFVQPSQFPFPQLVANIQGNSYLQTLLSNYGIGAEFNQDMDSMEQIAMAVTALGLANLLRINTARQSSEFNINSNQEGWLSATPMI